MNNDFAQLEAIGSYSGWHTEPIETISQLRVGDTIQSQLYGDALTVNRITQDGRVFAIRELEITNPGEWRLVVKNEQAGGVGDGSTL